VGDEGARSNRGLGYVDALDGPLSDGGSIPPASILEPLVMTAVLFLGGRTVRLTVRSGGRIRLLSRLQGWACEGDVSRRASATTCLAAAATRSSAA